MNYGHFPPSYGQFPPQYYFPGSWPQNNQVHTKVFYLVLKYLRIKIICWIRCTQMQRQQTCMQVQCTLLTHRRLTPIQTVRKRIPVVLFQQTAYDFYHELGAVMNLVPSVSCSEWTLPTALFLLANNFTSVRLIATDYASVIFLTASLVWVTFFDKEKTFWRYQKTGSFASLRRLSPTD